MTAPQHLALPLRPDETGGFVTHDQDSVDDITQCVQVVMSTPIGSRMELPQFGIPQLEFSTLPLPAMLTALYIWEPRASILVREALSRNDSMVVEIEAALST